jgi:DNA-binding MarR family transcriptional regulator
VPDLDVDAFAPALVAFNRQFIRAPRSARLSFSTLSVLDSLAAAGRPLRLSELTRTEQVTQPRLTQLVAQMERDGLVMKQPDPRDGRAVLIALTEKGRSVTLSRHEDRVERLRSLVGELAPEERDALAAVVPALRRLAELGAADER